MYLKGIDMITTGMFIFVICSIAGWIWEVFLNIVMCGYFVNRGLLYGPWLPIYGFGALLVLFIAYNVDNPWQVFVISAAACGVLEFVTSVIMETRWKMRWWDYGNSIFSINGRVNLLVIGVFGIIGLVAYYFVVPRLNTINSMQMPAKVIAGIIGVIIVVDFIYSQMNPNIAAISSHRQF